MSGSFGNGRGATGAAGAAGTPGYLVSDSAFTQPIVGGTDTIRWLGTAMMPAVGMFIASYSGLYEVTAYAGGVFYTIELLEARGVAPGGNVPSGTQFGQAGLS